MVGDIHGRYTMIITVGKVNAIIIPDIKYAALLKNQLNDEYAICFGVTYTQLLKSVFKIARSFQ